MAGGCLVGWLAGWLVAWLRIAAGGLWVGLVGGCDQVGGVWFGCCWLFSFRGVFAGFVWRGLIVANNQHKNANTGRLCGFYGYSVGGCAGWLVVALCYVRCVLPRGDQRCRWWGYPFRSCFMKGGGGIWVGNDVVQTLYFRKNEKRKIKKTKKSILSPFKPFKILWWYSCTIL